MTAADGVTDIPVAGAVMVRDIPIITTRITAIGATAATRSPVCLAAILPLMRRGTRAYAAGPAMAMDT